MNSDQIIFITGTDTGVGKTLLTALLLSHLRSKGVHALAMKPFCSGGLGDVELLQSLQTGEISNSEMNPYYFKKPVAPLVALNKNTSAVPLKEVVQRIIAVKSKCDLLLVEGSGGLLVPLGKDYMVSDLIEELGCKVIIAARNSLGTINHTLLTFNNLRSLQFHHDDLKIVLMQGAQSDPSCATNEKVIAQIVKPSRVLSLPFLGKTIMSAKNVNLAAENNKKVLQNVAFDF